LRDLKRIKKIIREFFCQITALVFLSGQRYRRASGKKWWKFLYAGGGKLHEQAGKAGLIGIQDLN